jgi:transposase
VVHAAEQDRPDVAAMRRRLRQRQASLDPNRLVFIDETAVTTSMTRQRGRCRRGERLVCKAPFGSWQSVTLVAALRNDRLIAPMLLEGAMTAEVFRAYIAQALGRCLKPGAIVVMDNVPLHRIRGVREALKKLKVIVPEFPADSPDLNPIEQAISKLKAALRKLAPRSLRILTAGVRKTLRHFSPAECAAYLRHSGYGQTKRKPL